MIYGRRYIHVAGVSEARHLTAHCMKTSPAKNDAAVHYPARSLARVQGLGVRRATSHVDVAWQISKRTLTPTP